MELLRSPKLVPSVLLVILFLAFCDVNIVMRASAEQKICNITEQELEECKPSVSGSDPPPPSTECCDAMKNADLPCLCSYKNSAFLPALGIDPDLAMQLPAKCGIKAPDNC
ncbi:putative lipid-transfer protein DIR1 [Carex rostrata]